MVPALVLTAGFATRLRPLSLCRAKAALPVAGVALIHRILRWLRAARVADVVMNLHHLPHTLTSLVGDGSDLGVRVRYSWESPVLGSAGGPKRAIPLLQSSTFLIVNGDTLTDVRVEELLDDHQRSGALVTLAVVPNTQPDKYGGVLVDGRGAFAGVTRRGSREPSFHFVGVQAVQAEAFADARADVASESVGALYPALAAMRPGSVRAFSTTAEFFDIGTPADYLATSILLAERESFDLTRSVGASISPAARIERSVLWDDVVVEGGAFLRECVVTDGVRVPADTSWHGVTLRVASGDLAPGERRIEHLAVSSLGPEP
jgi:NDP-sugar pyrophosphorylase family protein